MAMPTKRNEAVAAENGRDDAELQARFFDRVSSPACGLAMWPKSSAPERLFGFPQTQRFPMPIPSRSDLAKHWDVLDRNTCFLNHGSYGACPRFVREVRLHSCVDHGSSTAASYHSRLWSAQDQRKWQDVLETDPVNFFQNVAPAAMKASREALAVLCHCDPDDLALVCPKKS
jgi:hypothetical protein